MKLDERSSTPYCGVQNVSTPGNGGSWERVENVVWSGATIAGPRDGKERVGEGYRSRRSESGVYPSESCDAKRRAVKLLPRLPSCSLGP